MRRFRYLLLALVGLTACTNTRGGKDDLMGLLLGQMPFAIPFMSHSGSGNEGAAMEGALITMIALSGTNVSCAFEDVNLPGVIRALQFAASRGAEVRVGIDQDNKNGVGYRQLQTFLIDSGEDRRLWTGNSGVGKVGTNLCVGDHTRVWFSSAPPTSQGLYSETAFGMYLQDDEQSLPVKFTAETDLMTHGSFGSAKQRLNRRNFWTLGGMGFGVFMAPAEKPLEGFLVARVAQATSSIQLYSSEFFSNELDGSMVREKTDLAYEILHSTVPSKQMVGSLYAVGAADPSAFGALNSFNYLNSNGIPYKVQAGEWGDSGMSIILLDSMTTNPRLYVTSFGLGTRSDTSHDGFLIELEYRPFVDAFATFFNQIQARALASPSASGDDITTANNMEVVISEINWMGGYDSAGTATSSEYIELYNTTDRIINISGWRIECGSGGGFATLVSTQLSPTLIAPSQYFVLAQASSPLVQTSHRAALSGSNRISDTTVEQCRLTDSTSNGGTVVDTVGVNGTTLSSDGTHFGKNDTVTKIRRSMERNSMTTVGTDPNNWHTNSNSSAYQNINIAVDKIDRTFGTPGFENSANVPIAAVASATLTGVKINEVVWNNGGGSNNFVELYNTTASAIDLSAANAYIMRDSNCDLSNGVTQQAALTGTIAAGGYYVIATSGGIYAAAANQSNLGTINADDCVILTIGTTAPTAANSANVQDFVAVGAALTTENGVVAPGAATTTASRMPDGTDTNFNNADFQTKVASPGSKNGAPSYTSVPASAATSVALNSTIVLTFNEAMVPAGTVSVVGSLSGTQAPACVWTVGNTVCTLTPGSAFLAAETVTVTLSGFTDLGDGLAPGTLSFSFSTLNPGIAPTVTSVTVTATSPNNGTTPYNTGTTDVTIIGTNFLAGTGVSCPSGVTVATPTATTATSCNVLDDSTITATFPAGIRTNGTTGWNVVVTNSGGPSSNAVKFIPKAGLLISEVGQDYNANANDDWMQIYNPTANSINLNNYRWLRDASCNVAGGWTQSNITFGNVNIASHGYFLIGRTLTVSFTPDITTFGALGTNNCVAITFGGAAPTAVDPSSAGSSNIIDVVQWGAFTDRENGVSATDLAANRSSRRNGACPTTDTDFNNSDFTFNNPATNIAAPLTSASGTTCP